MTGPVTKKACPKSVNFLSPLFLLIILCIQATPSYARSADTQTQSWHPLADIRTTAANFVKRQAAKPGQRTTINPGELDDRLKLHLCDVPLNAYLPPGSRLGSNTTVGVRCTSPRKWKLFVPVRIGVAAEVLVASKPLAAGTVLTENDVITQERDLGSLRGGYIRAGEIITGMVLKRRLPEGEPVRNELLTAPNIVRRGQSLTIRSGLSNSSIRIRMAGTALSDGRLGQRIRVKNRSSGRTIEGIVRSSELIDIGY